MKYQLIKTSPLLSGQVRWDLILERKNNESFVKDVHIVPVSDQVVFNEDNDRVTLNYDHRENLRYLYRTLQSEFWSTVGLYDSEYPLYNQGHTLDPFDHTYEMGLRRMRYERYNKQFSFLCPVWISEDIDYSKLRFRVLLSDGNPTKKSEDEQKPNISTMVQFSRPVQDYIQEYMSGSDTGRPVSDDLVSFKFDPMSAYITGVNAETGKYQTVSVTDTLKDILDRERPLMEFDNMILDEFRLHNVVAQQLINFNLVFNLDDIVSNRVTPSLLFHDVNIAVEVMYGEEDSTGKCIYIKLPLKDLYSNYTNIPAYSIETDRYSNDNNVLEYLNDHRSRALCYVNKTVQPIFHWSLLENPEFIYNFYDGFAPVFHDDEGIQRVDGLYYNQSNLSQRKSSVLENTNEWCRSFRLRESDAAVDSVELLTNNLNSTAVPVAQDIIWFSNNKFDMSNVNITEVSPNLRVMTIQTTSIAQIPNSGSLEIYLKDSHHYLYMYRYNETIAFFSEEASMLTMGSIRDYISTNRSITDPDVLYIKQLFDHWEQPYKVEIFKSVRFKHVEMDNKVQDVVDYFKKDQFYSYLYRYTGKIIPCFIDVDNDMRYSLSFHYKQWTYPSDIADFNDKIKAGYIPEYPVIIKQEYKYTFNGFVIVDYIDIIDDNSFYSLVSRPFRSDQDSWYKDNDYQGDITWINDNKVWIFPTTLSTEIIRGRDIAEEELVEDVWNELYEIFKHSNVNIANHFDDTKHDTKWFKQYIKSIYKYSIVFEYDDQGQNINSIKYNIKYTLI